MTWLAADGHAPILGGLLDLGFAAGAAAAGPAQQGDDRGAADEPERVSRIFHDHDILFTALPLMNLPGARGSRQPRQRHFAPREPRT